MIVFDQETRQFSVIDETREFAKKRKSNTGKYIGAGLGVAGLAGLSLGAAYLKDRSDARRRKDMLEHRVELERSRPTLYRAVLDNRNDRRAHKEKMAMIKMGMDPSKLESDTLKRDKMHYDDRSDKRDVVLRKQSLKNEDRANRRDNRTERVKARHGQLDSHRQYLLDKRSLKNEDRADARKSGNNNQD